MTLCRLSLCYHTTEFASFLATPDNHQLCISQALPCCVQDQSTARKVQLMGLKMLLVLHMMSRTVLHKAAPSVFGGPRMLEVVMGKLPYRQFTSAIYQDGLIFAGFLTAAAAFALRAL